MLRIHLSGQLYLSLTDQALQLLRCFRMVRNHLPGEGPDVLVPFSLSKLARLDFEHVADGNFCNKLLRRVLSESLDAHQAQNHRNSGHQCLINRSLTLPHSKRASGGLFLRYNGRAKESETGIPAAICDLPQVSEGASERCGPSWRYRLAKQRRV